MSDNPYQSSNNPELAAGPTIEQVKSKVFPPAIALIVSGALSLMGAAWGIISWILAVADVYPTPEQQQELNQSLEDMFADSPETAEFVIGSLQFLQESVFSLLLTLVGLVLGIIVILGGIKMMQLSSYGLALTAAILNVISVVPFITKTCCCYGLPIGIWVLVVLMSSDVKAAFRTATAKD